jgi:hypothetical protein
VIRLAGRLALSVVLLWLFTLAVARELLKVRLTP